MAKRTRAPEDFRAYRNSRLYRGLTRTLRVYNRFILSRLLTEGFDDFQPAFPSMLSNLDMQGTRIGVLAQRAGVSRQAAGQLLKQIERCGYVELRNSPDDARATVVHFTARGRKLHAMVVRLVEEFEGRLDAMLKPGEFDRMRVGLQQIADRIDPVGAFGTGDESARGRRR